MPKLIDAAGRISVGKDDLPDLRCDRETSGFAIVEIRGRAESSRSLYAQANLPKSFEADVHFRLRLASILQRGKTAPCIGAQPARRNRGCRV